MAEELTSVPGGRTPDEDFLRLEDELGRLARELTPEDIRLETPPIDLWSVIEAEVAGMTTSGPAEDDPSDPQPLEAAGGAQLRTSRLGTPRGLGTAPPTPAPVRPSPLRSRSGIYSIPAALAAAAALAVVLATGAALIVRNTSGDVTTVAQAAIANDGLPVSISGAGTAVLKQRGDDQFLELDLPDLGAGDPNSIYEVWMIDTDVAGMISLGNLTTTGGETRIDLPDTIDHNAFPVIDISVEPLDGDPTHSGQSVLRGVLTDVEGA